MGKYWAIFKITWQNAVEYRMEFLAHMVLGLITLLVMYFIWSAVFEGRTYLGNYTFSSMMTYLVMVRFLHFVRRTSPVRIIADEIKEGKISAYLIKPVSYLRWWLAAFLAERIFESILRILMLFVFLILFPKIFNFPGTFNFLVILFFIGISLVLNYLFNLLISLFAFFVTDVRLFRSTVIMACDFFAGSLIPIDLMPGVLKKIGLLLPFQFWIYFPIKLYQGDLTQNQIVGGMSLLFVWLLIFIFIVKYLWQKGIRTYEAIGQ